MTNVIRWDWKPLTNSLMKVLRVSLALYAIAVLTTMAGMEIFGWLTALIVVGLLVVERRNWIDRVPILTWGEKILLMLFWAIIWSAFASAPEGTDRLFVIGSGRFVILFILMRFALTWMPDESIGRAVTWLMVLVGVIGAYSIFQHFTGIDFIRGHRSPVSQHWFSDGTTVFRARGMWGHPVTFGHAFALSLCFPLAIVFAGRDLGRMVRKIAISVAVIGLIALILSFTRGAWLAVMAAAFVMSMYAGRRVAVTVAMTTLVAISIAVAASPNFRQRVVSIFSVTDTSNTQRMDLWRANVEIFKENPIFGVGYGVNENVVQQYFEKLGIVDGYGGHAHNNFLQFLAGTGLIGLTIFLAFVLYFLWINHRLLRSSDVRSSWVRPLALAAMGAQVALHVGGLTECNFKDAEVNHQYMLILAVLTVLYRRYVMDTSEANR